MSGAPEPGGGDPEALILPDIERRCELLSPLAPAALWASRPRTAECCRHRAWKRQSMMPPTGSPCMQGRQEKRVPSGTRFSLLVQGHRREETAAPARAALDRRSHQFLVVELRTTPPQHRPQVMSPPRRPLPGHHRAHRRKTPRLPRPMEPHMTPIRSGPRPGHLDAPAMSVCGRLWPSATYGREILQRMQHFDIARRRWG